MQSRETGKIGRTPNDLHYKSGLSLESQRKIDLT